MLGINRLKNFCHEAKDIAIAAAMLALIVSAVVVVREAVPAIRSFTAVLDQAQASAKTFNGVLATADKTMEHADKVLKDFPNKVATIVNTQATDIRKDLFARVDNISDKLDDQITDIAGKLDTQLGALNASVSKVASIRDDLKPTFENVNVISSRLRRAADQTLNCEAPPAGAGGACLPAQSLALVGSWRSMSGNIAKATPEAIVLFESFVKQGQETNRQITGIATDAHAWTTKMVAKQPWYKKAGNVAVMMGAAALKGGVF